MRINQTEFDYKAAAEFFVNNYRTMRNENPIAGLVRGYLNGVGKSDDSSGTLVTNFFKECIEYYQDLELQLKDLNLRSRLNTEEKKRIFVKFFLLDFGRKERCPMHPGRRCHIINRERFDMAHKILEMHLSSIELSTLGIGNN